MLFLNSERIHTLKSAAIGVIKINEHIKSDHYNQHFVKLECICILCYSFLSPLKISQDFPQGLADFPGLGRFSLALELRYAAY